MKNKKLINLRNSFLLLVFWIVVYLLLYSCKTTKSNCDAYGQSTEKFKDSTKVIIKQFNPSIKTYTKTEYLFGSK